MFLTMATNKQSRINSNGNHSLCASKHRTRVSCAFLRHLCPFRIVIACHYMHLTCLISAALGAVILRLVLAFKDVLAFNQPTKAPQRFTTEGERHPIASQGERKVTSFKAGGHLKPVFSTLNYGLMRISRSRFKQTENPLLISLSYV